MSNILEVQIVEYEGKKYLPVDNEEVFNIVMKSIAAIMKNRTKARERYTGTGPRKQYKPDIIINTTPRPLVN